MPSTKPSRRPLGELMGGADSATTCPACGRPHAFHVTNTYTKTKNPHRLRKCRFCPHVQDELVPRPVPVIEGETAFEPDPD
jgi:rubredoxin